MSELNLWSVSGKNQLRNFVNKYQLFLMYYLFLSLLYSFPRAAGTYNFPLSWEFLKGKKDFNSVVYMWGCNEDPKLTAEWAVC